MLYLGKEVKQISTEIRRNKMLTMTEERKNRLTEYYKRKTKESYFAVEKIKLSEDRYGIINRETNELISTVSKRYCLVKNWDVVEPFIKEFGHENIKKFYTYGKGKYLYMEIKTGRKFNFGTEDKPDWIEEILIIQNSYDKTKSFQFKLGAFRWVCSNGLFSGVAIINYKKIHVGNINIFKLIMDTLTKYKDNTFENWKRLKEVPLTREESIKLIDGLTLFKEKNDKGETNHTNVRLNQRIRRQARWKVAHNSNVVDNQPNAWGLFNQINYAIDCNIGGKSQITKRINTNYKMEDYLNDRLFNKKDSFSIGMLLN
jgi:hypothetical protein